MLSLGLRHKTMNMNYSDVGDFVVPTKSFYRLIATDAARSLLKYSKNIHSSLKPIPMVDLIHDFDIVDVRRIFWRCARENPP